LSKRYIFISGDLYFKECHEFLIKRNLPLVVGISEDGTRVLSRVEYDPQSNQLIGFVTPLDKNGIPTKMAFPAICASAIAKYFASVPKASYVIAIMVQPICLGISIIFFNL
jgi:hypothetical protein